MTDRPLTTHAPGCWGWGPRHYECALRQIEHDEALLRQIERDEALLRQFERDEALLRQALEALIEQRCANDL